MTLLGVHMTLLVGPTVPIPAPPNLLEALESVEVVHGEGNFVGFDLNFRIGRSGPTDLLDYSIVSSPLLRAFNRVIVLVTFGVVPQVLVDGIITLQQLLPGSEPGTGTFRLKGKDVSVMMGLEEKSAEHPAQDETLIALKVIASYAQYGLIPAVIPPVAIDPPLPIERVPVQQQTDLEFLRRLATRHGYLFYVVPGPAPFTNTAYWGPPIRIGVPQPAITVNMGPETNATIGEVAADAEGPATMEGQVQDRTTGQKTPVRTFASTRIPLASQPALLANQPNVRKRQFRQSGLTSMQAMGRAQGQTDASTDDFLTLHGSLDGARYGRMLQARALVGVRGAGYAHDGFYYVKRVKHVLRVGSYTQEFQLTRDGLGSTTLFVVP
jgi:hypothetical protein